MVSYIDSTPAAAQPNADLATVLNASVHLSAVYGAVAQSTTWVRHGCKFTSYATPVLSRVWQRPLFNGDGLPVAGKWTESVTTTGCGLTRILNAVTTVESAGALRTGVLAPGGTVASPDLQPSLSHQVFQKALADQPECTNAFIDDTGRRGEQETWTVMACGRMVPVMVNRRAPPGG